jgi:PatG C-terminal/PatG Domain
MDALADDVPEGERMHHVLASPDNQYLVRNLCWVFSVRGQDAFVLSPADPMDWKLLPETLEEGSGGRVDVVIGHLGPPAGPCAGLGLPLVHFDRLHSFSRTQLLEQLDGLREARELPADHFRQAFDQLIALAEDNPGTAEADRALNYLVLRYPDIYQLVTEQLTAGRALESVRATPSPVGAPRLILDVVLSFLDSRDGGYGRHYVRVDVTEEFPFLVSGVAPYVEH